MSDVQDKNDPDAPDWSFHSAKYVAEDGTAVTMMLKHPKHGWIPITINEEEYPDVWNDVIAADEIAPFVPKPAPGENIQ